MPVALSISILVALSVVWRPVLAQETTARIAAREFLEADVADRVVLSDTLLDFETRRVPHGRVDVATGVLRAAYSIQERVSPGLPPETAALRYLEQRGQTFGLQRPEETLHLERVRRTPHATHVTFRQMHAGIPVYNREIQVNLNRDGQPTLVVNSFAERLADVQAFDVVPRVSAAEAMAIVQASAVAELDSTEPELAVYPSEQPLLAWKLRAWPRYGHVEWEVLVNAQTGEIFQVLDLSPHAHRRPEPRVSGPSPRAMHTASRPSDMASKSSTATLSSTGRIDLSPGSLPAPVARAAFDTRTDGSGLVFDPDPLSSAGVAYGCPYCDANDADIPELNAERFEVVLRDVTRGADGLHRLEGPYVVIDGSRQLGDTEYVPPAEPTPRFAYTRANDFFEAVMVYYHIDRNQRYLQSLSVGFDVMNAPVRANPHGLGDRDDSQYFPARKAIAFGRGGVDDAEDADVILHEYAHALLDDVLPGLLVSTAGRAYHEGWADYWAASYSRYLSEEDPRIPPHDWRQVFNWDGNNESICWFGRRLDHPGRYPDDTTYPTTGCVQFHPIYHSGLLWATTMMDVYDDVGRDVLDRLHVASFAYLPPSGFRFDDAAQALIQADEDLHGGVHTGFLIDRLAARGYVDPAAYGPVLAHDPLPATEQVGGTVSIEVTVQGTTAVVDSVLVVFGWDAAPDRRLKLVHQGGDRYTGDLPLPPDPARVRYFVEAVDAVGRRRRLPSGAPTEVYDFAVGPDEEAPVIAHDPPAHVSVVGWPLDLYADVKDNIGVDSVWVEYTLREPSGLTGAEGSFGMSLRGGTYHGRFPGTYAVAVGYTASYRILARDVSFAGNVAAFPHEGAIDVPVIGGGVVRSYDFDGVGQGFVGTGAWERDRPLFGVQFAHAGERVWATAPGKSYPSTPSLSTLEFPPHDLSGIGQAYLIFWHWYDFEHDGRVGPGAFDGGARLWDGGNVKASTDGGATWTILQPEGGYNGVVAGATGNPLAGEPAFGGYSFGWRREIVPLPEHDDLYIRLDFGTDDGNVDHSLHFAGWYVDAVTITTEYPEDDRPPEAIGLPEARIVRVAGRPDEPRVTIRARDDTGIEAALMNYELWRDGNLTSASTRLAMSETDRETFSGLITPPHTYSPGDRIEYRIRLRDFDGNESVYPPQGAFVVDYRALHETDALESVVATGIWRRQGSTWTTTGQASGHVSSLVLEPFTLPANAEDAAFIVAHQFSLGEGLGGNVKVSPDDGRTWLLLTPDDAYPGTLQVPSSHPMWNEGVFTGQSFGTVHSAYDLSTFIGLEVRVRIDFAHVRAGEPGEAWNVLSAGYRAHGLETDVEILRELTLHANFPNPFADRTTISYTIPGPSPVRLSVFDVLGRRVAVVLHELQEEGTYTVSFDGIGLATGVYVLYLETLMGTRSRQVIVAR